MFPRGIMPAFFFFLKIITFFFWVLSLTIPCSYLTFPSWMTVSSLKSPVSYSSAQIKEAVTDLEFEMTVWSNMAVLKTLASWLWVLLHCPCSRGVITLILLKITWLDWPNERKIDLIFFFFAFSNFFIVNIFKHKVAEPFESKLPTPW